MGCSDKWGGSTGWVLVAGSNGWYNYRHQADVCHANQILKKNGILDEQIVVMYKNIANNEENPTKDIIINRLSRTDVYAGVLKDYIKEFETLHKQFLLVTQHTNTSHVIHYGNKTISKRKVSQFQGCAKQWPLA
ncbi:hypothetical protein AB205_0064950 [Aquarana catesbeiana]|uniref:Uncharacterized protein n=1 Tax=Aquarana catesbeiana TaxID=8400 RepID=A0A2G9QG45_AQUCT|nr:hypothetical protein AB205_0064950 [Aquarana catesbeiana]